MHDSSAEGNFKKIGNFWPDDFPSCVGGFLDRVSLNLKKTANVSGFNRLKYFKHKNAKNLGLCPLIVLPIKTFCLALCSYRSKALLGINECVSFFLRLEGKIDHDIVG